MSRPIFVTGSAGFIGYHLCQRLLSDGFEVIGLDAMTDYYDVSLKQRRHALLETHEASPLSLSAWPAGVLEDLPATHKPAMIVHLAAQARVRYSIDASRSYVESNISGTFELLEAVRHNPVEHLLIAFMSSIYGANTEMTYCETHKVDAQMSFYAATKKPPKPWRRAMRIFTISPPPCSVLSLSMAHGAQ
jgi:UDP-glucuronate 4-epimerase